MTDAELAAGPERTQRSGPGRRVLGLAAAVTVLTLVLVAVVALTREAEAPLGGIAVLCLVAGISSWRGTTQIDDKVVVSLTGILVLAAMALGGPLAAAAVAAVGSAAERENLPLYARVYNAAMNAAAGVLGGLAFVAVGGQPGVRTEGGALGTLQHLALPLIVGDLTQMAVNLVLLMTIIRVSGGPARSIAARLLRSTGAMNLGYGVVALLLVVLWLHAGLGVASLALVLAPLLAAQWAYAQLGDELVARDRALDVLVAAVEVKAPHLAGHSRRVAELGTRMAETLGLRSQTVADVRLAAMLHDVGQTTYPTLVVRGMGHDAEEERSGYPQRSVEILSELAFMRGALAPIRAHREVRGISEGAVTSDAAAEIVGVADEFDLLTEVGTSAGLTLSRAEALELLRSSAVRPELVDALEGALDRLPRSSLTEGAS